MKEPLSVGPGTVDDDEREIARSYRNWPWFLVPAVIPLGVAWFADEKMVIAVGFCCGHPAGPPHRGEAARSLRSPAQNQLAVAER